MKTLYAPQMKAAERFLDNLKKGKHTLDSSEVGTGKTVVAAYLAKQLGMRVGVVCPKSVIPMWDREMIDMGVEPDFILNYEKLRTGKTAFLKKRGKKIMNWCLDGATFVIFDEVHKCKGAYTLNAQLLISLVLEAKKKRGHLVHAISATASEDPTEMRSLGFMLGLHDLNKHPNSWVQWMLDNGCEANHWGSWEIIYTNKLLDVHRAMYGEQGGAYRLSIKDFPDSFKENRVFVEPIHFKDQSGIEDAYDSLGITADVVEQFIDGELEPEDLIIVRILRARQQAESLKIPDIIDMTTDLIGHGKSVVVFMNFRDSVERLASQLNCAKIVGGQSDNERQNAIDDFQMDIKRVLVVNIAAGGTGLSLHDIHGVYPRVSLINPTFAAKDHVQALGRIHRNGAKSHALQKILVAAGSVEETVVKAIKRKIKNLNTLHTGSHE
tara:strand:+ start:4796 stop:6109 length:1314 start_codon:yes stop_codon:yes gene_type:complete